MLFQKFTTLNYLDELNSVQRDAVTAIDGPVMVIAGPGSGKTRVLTYRIAHIINSGVPPQNILSLTFTNKAAREMKERIGKVVGRSAHWVWAGTFHSIFSRILRNEAEKIGYSGDFTIYDSDDSKNLVAAIIKEMNLNKEDYNPGVIRNRISSAKSNLITPKMYIANEELMKQDFLAKRPETGKIYNAYMKRCIKANAMDFDDLLLQTYILFKNNKENVLDKYRARFTHILVDEFQDTNFLQYAIIKKLCYYDGSPMNICIVGDDAQSIYAFRGATIDNILNFEKDFSHLRTYKLEQNYRSTNHIVAAANSVIKKNEKQINKTIWTSSEGGEKIRLVRTLTDSEEGKRVADLILEVKNRHHIPNNEIAILYRTNSQSRSFEEFLRKVNVPYKVFGGMSFYQRKEVKDLLAYFRVAVNPNDEEALKRIINYPKRGIGNTTIQKLTDLAGEENITLFEALKMLQVSGKAGTTLADFVQLIEKFRQKSKTLDAYDAARLIAKESGIMAELNRDDTIEGISRKENIVALLDAVKEYTDEDILEDEEDEMDAKTLSNYLRNVALISDLDSENKEGEEEKVTLMTIHSAKGLEFDAVFVVGLEENLFPGYLSMKSAQDIDEERRLFYVSITRARKFLYLTYANSRYQYGSMRFNDPSRFIEEIDPEALDLAQAGRSFNQMNAVESPLRSGISGGIPLRKVVNKSVNVDMTDFKPSSANDIQTGMRVLHPKFGEGKVLSIDGVNANRVATIFFKDVDMDQQKRVMLKFAKLQIID